VVEKAGSWFSYEGQRIGQGRENVKKFLADNPEMMERIRVQAMNKLTGKEEEEPQAPSEPPKKDIFEDAFDDMPIAIEVVDEEL
ncbi:MAG: DNA recombination/repair protein RecA, partial [Firmicutes bacterium]|nr:DNA recombination/repair protein RecA [Bacillota bacterium]